MKTNLILTVILCCTLSVVLSSYGTDSKASDGWKLVWEENFDSQAGLDLQKWSKIPRGPSDWNNYMSDFDSCYAFAEGNLLLRGIVNRSLPNDTAPYLTGGVYTKDKMTFQNGRLEIRAKLDPAKGAWPAIWMLPVKGQWPNGGEIDIMERLNYDSIAYQTVHSHYTYTLGIKENPRSHSTGKIDSRGYNVYAVELYPDSISFYINDTHTFTYPRIDTTEEGQFPYNAPFYLLIDMQLGGPWVGSVGADDLPVEMAVDWVRFYQKEE